MAPKAEVPVGSRFRGYQPFTMQELRLRVHNTRYWRERARIEKAFETMCTTRTCFETLNQALERMHCSKAELLRVLERPELPLHNNASERDIREYVKKR